MQPTSSNPVPAVVATGAAATPEELPRRNVAQLLGPGLLTGASDDDPSGIGTYAQVGAQFGTGLLWTMLFSYPLMVAVQLMCARIGRVTGRGLAANLGHVLPSWGLMPLVGLLVVANTINIGADLGAMGAAVQLLVAGPAVAWTVGLGLLSAALEVAVPYHRYVVALKWLTIALLAYVAAALVVRVPWASVGHDAFVPSLPGGRQAITAVVAILGTTISPYLFFWQASQEIEDMKSRPGERPLRRAPKQASAQLHRIGVDTWVGMGASNLVGFFIILTTAATLHAAGQRDISSAAQAAEALKPVAGAFASFVFAAGIVGTGLLAVPVLAGSSAYAVAETMHWRWGLERAPSAARGFYAVIALATLAGTAMNFANVNPIRALFWTAVINGVIAVPMLVAVVWLASRRDTMGRYSISTPLRVAGWVTALVMAACVAGMALA